MNALKELIQLISPGKLRFVQVIGSRNNTHVDQLYNLIHSGKIESLDEISEHFFPEARHRHTYARNLKAKLEQRMLVSLFLIEPDEKSTDVQKAYFYCYRNFSALKILSGLGMIKPFVGLAEKTIRKAKAYGFTEIVASLSKMCRRVYGEMIGDLKKYQIYAETALKYDELLYAENLAEYYNSEFLIHFSNSRAANPHLLDKMEHYVEALEKYTKRYDSRKLHFCYYRILITKYQIQSDHHKVIEMSQSALSFFSKEGAATPAVMRFMFLYYAIPSYIHLGKNELALNSINECLRLVEPQTYNYYATSFYQVLLGFHNRELVLVSAAIETVDLAKIPIDALREQWRIAIAYYHLYKGSEFKLGKFLNQMPIFDQDKRGNKINILILQILFFLRDKKYNRIINRIESLKQYTHRYLRKDDTFRSNCFIKMLLQLPQADFHPVAVRRKSKPYLAKLKTKPLNLAQQGSELEVVPYEILWEKVLSLVDEK